jgi:hypothetical protein
MGSDSIFCRPRGPMASDLIERCIGKITKRFDEIEGIAGHAGWLNYNDDNDGDAKADPRYEVTVRLA